MITSDKFRVTKEKETQEREVARKKEKKNKSPVKKDIKSELNSQVKSPVRRPKVLSSDRHIPSEERLATRNIGFISRKTSFKKIKRILKTDKSPVKKDKPTTPADC